MKGENTRMTIEESTPKWEQEMKAMRAQMGEMKDEFKGRAAKNLDDLVHGTDSPFTKTVTSFPLPSKFRMPTLETFDGSKDPLDHLESFKTMMCLQGVPNEIMCRAFPTTLKGPARIWFKKLTPSSKEGETLRSYLTRFNKETLLVDGADDKVILTAFISGLQSGDFLFSVYKDPPSTMTEMMYEAQRHMNGEEALQARDQTSGKKRKWEHADYHIFMQIRNDPTLKWPGKLLTNPDKRPRDKYCRFHRDHGHNTEDCYDLKRQIEELIKQGKLQRFVERGQREGRPQGAHQQRPRVEVLTRPPPPLGEIHKTDKKPRLEDFPITFTEEDAHKVFHPHDDALVVTLEIAGYSTRRVLIDNGSSADIIYLTAFQQMKIGTYPKQATKKVDFLIVDCLFAYNVIVGRPTLNRLRAVTSTYYLLVCFPTENGIGEIRGDQAMARECYLTSISIELVHQTLIVEERQNIAEPTEELEEIILIEGNEKKTTRIGTSMTKEIWDSIVRFLRENADVFAWSHDNMLGISTEVIAHKLNVNPSISPVKQKRRVFAPDRNAAVMEEVDKLLMAGFIREVYYPEWLANVVMVKKSTGKWRMCVDFTDLNKACPKDSYPLPRIDQLVDSTAGHKLLSFMDAFSGYNQIQMTKEDQEKTAFITSRGLFCYKAMPFGLKNVGATYQRLINKMFHHQIGRNVEVYVDDMLVKSKKDDDHLTDLKETFQALRRYNIKLNPAKCVFRVSFGKFLGFMVSQRGIEANADKIKVILEMSPPKTVKEVQSLTGKAVALNRFVSKSTDKCLLFFKTLRKAFEWTEECQQAFEELKWSIEMSEFDIDYRPRTAIKAQALADFIAEFTHPLKEDEQSEEDEAWTVNIDGSSIKEMSGAGVILVSPEKDKLEYALQLRFRATKNEAKYEALLARLKLAKSIGVKNLNVKSDSQLIIGQVKGEYEVKEDRMKKYLTVVKDLLTHFKKVELLQIPREENVAADCLAREGTLPADKTEAHKLRIRASHFRLLRGILSRWVFHDPILDVCCQKKRITSSGRSMKGICGNHSGARSLAHKLTRAGYYRPSLLHDATQYVKTCDKCQRFANVPRVPPEEITPITSPWPFAQWGLDIMGPFPGAKSMWVEELPSVLWAYRTTVRTPTKETPFKLTFGTEAVIPVEIGLTTLRTTFHKEEENEGAASYYNTKVKLRRFEVGDWVLRKVTQATKDPSQGKLGPNWEGPYKIIQYYRREDHQERSSMCSSIYHQVRHPRGALIEEDRQERSSIYHQVRHPRGALIEEDRQERSSIYHQVRHPRGALIEEDRQERSSIYHQVRHPRGALMEEDRQERSSIYHQVRHPKGALIEEDRQECSFVYYQVAFMRRTPHQKAVNTTVNIAR
uniref:RNase H type-1 domain-containing protein n=1 Tax=Fagus sylvatica TaxID=28930 RepID=A0A2N9FY65_FAGSY